MGWIWFIIGAVFGFVGAIVLAMPHVMGLEDKIKELRQYIKNLPTV